MMDVINKHLNYDSIIFHTIFMIFLLVMITWPVFAFADDDNPIKSGNFLCKGGHYHCSVPPSEYKYHQFGMTHLEDFAGYSDLLNPGPPLLHYQTFLVELDSRRADTNAVAFWGDAMARANKTRVWGGFFSARSELKPGDDAQLIGCEIDVLNDGLPGIYPNNSKVGLQIVGFGKTNTNAIEVLSQDKDKGNFMNIINVQPNTISEEGTLFGIAPQHANIGLNLLGSKFNDSAILLSSNNPITFRTDVENEAKIYTDDNGYLVLKLGVAGLRIIDEENSTDNLLFLDTKGNLSVAGMINNTNIPQHTGSFALIINYMAIFISFLSLLFSFVVWKKHRAYR